MSPCTQCSVPGFNHPVDGFLHSSTLSAFCATTSDTTDPNYTRHYLRRGDSGDGFRGAYREIADPREAEAPAMPLVLRGDRS